MSFQLTQKQWEDIYSYQAKEIEMLATDAEFARRASLLDHYSRIGEWLVPELGRRVLELGCGPGRYVAMLASLDFDPIGVDPVSYVTWKTIKRSREVEFRDGISAESLPFPDSSFDHVACIAALLYFDDPIRSLAEIRRVLRPEGRLVMRSVSRWNLYRLINGKNIDPVARNHYTMGELVRLLSDAGFAVQRTFSYGFYPPFFSGRWWHLMNGGISIETQAAISALTPPPLRSNLVAFCAAPSSDAPLTADCCAGRSVPDAKVEMSH
jgi:ubiquinone/menaquinone biosynthesis C-methylase UbiE